LYAVVNFNLFFLAEKWIGQLKVLLKKERLKDVWIDKKVEYRQELPFLDW
jgi:hypothetical protein